MKMNIRYFKWADLDESKRDYLYNHFTLGDGEMRVAIDVGLLEHCFIAFGPNEGIIGWTGLYKYTTLDDEIFNVGVFVRKEYRHRGIGETLRAMVVEFALREFGECMWFDVGKNGVATIVMEQK